MNGTMLIFRPGEDLEVRTLDATPEIETLHELVGGYIEAVPGFDRVAHAGTEQRCVAFCNEEGKLNGLPPNTVATVLWRIALGRPQSDWLVGPVVVLYGDREFMEDL